MSDNLLPLFLSVKTLNWRMDDDYSADADNEFKGPRKAALSRDKHTCRFCEFHSNKWMEVHHFNDDHSDNRLENLVTTCTFCHMCQHIGLAGRNKEAVLIWLPEISQVDLHHFVRSRLVAKKYLSNVQSMVGGLPSRIDLAKSIANSADSIMASLMNRQEQAELRIRTSDPLDLANSLLALPDPVYDKRRDLLHGIRMLPLGVRMQNGANIMEKQVSNWMEDAGAYSLLDPTIWIRLMTSALDKN